MLRVRYTWACLLSVYLVYVFLLILPGSCLVFFRRWVNLESSRECVSGARVIIVCRRSWVLGLKPASSGA